MHQPSAEEIQRFISAAFPVSEVRLFSEGNDKLVAHATVTYAVIVHEAATT